MRCAHTYPRTLHSERYSLFFTKHFIQGCPREFPFAYSKGAHCCAWSTEKIYKPHGSKCDGSLINGESTCCGAMNQPCPNGACRNYKPDAKSGSGKFSRSRPGLFKKQNLFEMVKSWIHTFFLIRIT